MNNDVKQAYVKTRKSQKPATVIALMRMFGRCIPLEESLGKDLCEFSEQEILENYKNNFNCNSSSLQNYNSLYAQYTEFCMRMYPERFNISCNAYKKFNKKYFDNMIDDSIILTEEVLRSAIMRMWNPVDKFLCVAAREGMSRQEIRAAKYEDITGNTIRCYELDDEDNRKYIRTIAISEEFKQYAYESANTFTTRSVKDNQILKRELFTGDMIVKPKKDVYDNITCKLAVIKQKYWLITKEIEPLITYDSLRTFGIYQFISKLGIQDEEDVTLENRNKLNTQFNSIGKYNNPKEWIALQKTYQ